MSGTVRHQTLRIAVPLTSGETEVSAAWTVPAAPALTVVLAHGAGTRYDHPGMVTLAEAFAERGAAALRFNFPYSEAGRRMPGPPAAATTTWRAAMAVAAASSHRPVIAAGRSYGGRMASVAASASLIDPAALVYLGYPLHPPGRPEAPRTAHLGAVRAPQLFVTGTRDPFALPRAQLEDAVRSCRDATLAWVEGAGHSFEQRGRDLHEVAADLADLVIAWLPRAVPGLGRPRS